MRKFISVIALVTLSATAGAATIEMKVNGLVCAFCAQGIEKTLKAKPEVDEVYVSLKRKVVALTTKEGKDIGDEDLKKALKDAGYDVKSVARTDRSLKQLREDLK